MKNNDGFNRHIQMHIGDKFLLRSGKVVIIVKPYEEIKEVRITQR